MKRLNQLMYLILGSVLLLGACNEDDNLLSDQDQEILEALENAYTQAEVENESFKIAWEEGDSTAIHRHDSLFHHYSDEFDHHHMEYSHGNGHDDHKHDSGGMHMMGHSMNMHQSWTEGHHTSDHDLMDELREDHHNIDHQSHFHN